MKENSNSTNKTTNEIGETSCVLYFDAEGNLKKIGNFEVNHQNNFIRATIKSNVLVLKAVPSFGYDDTIGTYYKSLEDRNFKKLIFNYCAYKNVPGIYLSKIDDSNYMDIYFNKTDVTEIVKAVGGTVAEMPDDDENETEPVMLHSVTDLFYWSLDTNPRAYIFNDSEYVENYRSAASCIKSLKSSIDTADFQKVTMLIKYAEKLIAAISRKQFENGFNSGRKQMSNLWETVNNSGIKKESAVTEIDPFDDTFQNVQEMISYINEKRHADDF